MRYGFTTGSCAAAAAKAAAYMLLLGRKKTEITIETPKGIPYTAQILDIRRTEDVVSCAVQKDGGDDPDVTTGAWIYAKVTYCGNDRKDFRSQADFQSRENLQSLEDTPYVQIDGGIGVGRVTKPGLDQPVGNAAINHVPREMITKEVLEVCRLVDYKGGLAVEIFVPEGEQLAEQTFNPRLGIKGGISILGSSGIVEPMSSQAILDTIRVELRQRRAEGYAYVAVAPGNYGLDFMKQAYGYGSGGRFSKTALNRTYRQAHQSSRRHYEYTFQRGGLQDGADNGICDPTGNQCANSLRDLSLCYDRRSSPYFRNNR